MTRTNLMTTEVAPGYVAVGAREIRMVPPTWAHPKDERGRYVPLFPRRALADADEIGITEADVMPDFGTDATHLALYEACSEGTPVSPAFETREELADWLADNGVSAFADKTLTAAEWLAAFADCD